MSFFKDFKDDLSQAVNELMPDDSGLPVGLREESDEAAGADFGKDDIADLLKNIDSVSVDEPTTQFVHAAIPTPESMSEAAPSLAPFNAHEKATSPVAGSSFAAFNAPETSAAEELFGMTSAPESASAPVFEPEAVSAPVFEPEAASAPVFEPEVAPAPVFEAAPAPAPVFEAAPAPAEPIAPNPAYSAVSVSEPEIAPAPVAAAPVETTTTQTVTISEAAPEPEKVPVAPVFAQETVERPAPINTTMEDFSMETGVIISGMSVTGDIKAEGNLDVLGSVTGNIDVLGKLEITGTVKGNSKAEEVLADGAQINGEIIAAGSVKVGQSTVIKGNITATSAHLAGAVKGDIDVQGPVVLDATAIIMGNIKSKSIQINNGAVIEGLCSQCYADVSPMSFFGEDTTGAK